MRAGLYDRWIGRVPAAPQPVAPLHRRGLARRGRELVRPARTQGPRRIGDRDRAGGGASPARGRLPFARAAPGRSPMPPSSARPAPGWRPRPMPALRPGSPASGTLLAAGARHPDRSARHPLRPRADPGRRSPGRGDRGVVRALPALAGPGAGARDHPARGRVAPARAAQARVRRRLSAAHPSHRHHQPQGPRTTPSRPRPGDVGSPWAVGSDDGGHEAVAPELGGLDGFLHFQRAAERLGMEVALDLAIQASPDHPWVAEAPGVVPPRPRRVDPLRREPAQALPGRLPVRLPCRRSNGPRRAVGRVACRSC